MLHPWKRVVGWFYTTWEHRNLAWWEGEIKISKNAKAVTDALAACLRPRSEKPAQREHEIESN